jgi:hypothetical protein
MYTDGKLLSPDVPDGLEAACDPAESTVINAQTFFDVPLATSPRASAVEKVCQFVHDVVSMGRLELCGLHLIKSAANSQNVEQHPLPIHPANDGVVVYNYTSFNPADTSQAESRRLIQVAVDSLRGKSIDQRLVRLMAAGHTCSSMVAFSTSRSAPALRVHTCSSLSFGTNQMLRSPQQRRVQPRLGRVSRIRRMGRSSTIPLKCRRG